MKTPPGYESFVKVLEDALYNSAYGKGYERHGDGRPFKDQFLMVTCDHQRGVGFPIGQASKKALESMRLSPDKAYQEAIEAIVYLVGAALWYKKELEEDAKAIEDGVDLAAPQSLTVRDCKQMGLWPEWDPSSRAGHTDYDD